MLHMLLSGWTKTLRVRKNVGYLLMSLSHRMEAQYVVISGVPVVQVVYGVSACLSPNYSFLFLLFQISVLQHHLCLPALMF